MGFGYLLYHLAVPHPSDAERAEEYLGRRLPESAHDVHFDETVFTTGERFLPKVIGSLGQLVFDSNNRAEVMSWLYNARENLHLRDDNNPFEDSAGERWWQPERDVRFPYQGGHCHDTEEEFKVLIIDLDDDLVRVYFSLQYS